MGKLQTITYVDDLDGSAAEETPMTFGIDGKHYEIDLSGANKEKLRAALAPFVAAARRATGGSGARRPASAAATKSTRPDREQTQAIREWANSNGFTVAERGRIPATVREAYDEAQRGTVSAIRQAPVAASEPKPEAPAKPDLSTEGVKAAVAAKGKAPGKAPAAKPKGAQKAVKVSGLTKLQTAAVEDLKIPTHEVASTFVVFKSSSPDEVGKDLADAVEAFTGDKSKHPVQSTHAIARKLGAANPKFVTIIDVEADDDAEVA